MTSYYLTYNQFHFFFLDFYSNHYVNFIIFSILLTIEVIGAIVLALTSEYNF